VTTIPPRRGAIVVASLFTTLFLVFGSGYNTAGVFVAPLVAQFGWTRAQVSLLQTTVALAAGLVVPGVGWLLDRVEARVTILAGAVLAGAGFLVASRAGSLSMMIAAYALVGIGLGAATLLPASLVIANSFGARRGLALGIVMLGTSTGGMVMTLVASAVIARAGWRTAYVALALPILLVVVPLVAVTVRSRPHADVAAAASGDAPGLEVGAAVGARSFWLVGVVQFVYGFAAGGTTVHAIPHFIDLGYGAERAAFLMSLVLGIAGAGKLATGALADRISARRALVLDLVVAAAGMTCLILARQAALAAAFVVLYGVAVGAPLTLMPLVIAESFGLRRFGSLSGLAGVFNILGAAAGPLMAGRIFDATGSYASAFTLYALALLVGAAATAGCVPLGAAAPSPLERKRR
jgi:MFS family permease